MYKSLISKQDLNGKSQIQIKELKDTVNKKDEILKETQK